MSGTKGTRDDTDLISVTVPFYAPTEADILTLELEPPFGLEEVSRDWDDVEGMAGFIVSITFEGFEDGRDDGKVAIDFDPSFGEEPIESHPAFLRLKDTYGGTVDDKGKVKWDEELKNVNDPLAGRQNEDTKNPMFGISTYLALKTVFRKTYTVRELPDNLLEEYGELTDELSEDFPTPSGRNWLLLPPKISKRGNVFQVTEERMLSPIGGKWAEGVHGLIQV